MDIRVNNILMCNMPELMILGERSRFKYERTVEHGTKILFGRKQIFSISSQQYKDLLRIFKRRTVNIGTSRTSPPSWSVGGVANK